MFEGPIQLKGGLKIKNKIDVLCMQVAFLSAVIHNKKRLGNIRTFEWKM